MAHAGTLSITLNSSLLTGTPGSELTFTGTLTNTSLSSAPLDQAGVDLFGFSPSDIDTNLFFVNAPLSLDPNATTGPIDLFTVNIPTDVLSGTYKGTFTVSESVGFVEGSADFTVQVVPEPRYMTFLPGGVLVFLLARSSATRALKKAV